MSKKKKEEEVIKETREKEAPEVNVSSPFFLSFFGQRVKVLTSIFQSFSVNTPEGIAQESLPITIMGYILDADDQYYYIGSNPHEIKQAIKKEKVIAIEVYTEEDEQAENYDKLLEGMGVPKRNEQN